MACVECRNSILSFHVQVSFSILLVASSPGHGDLPGRGAPASRRAHLPQAGGVPEMESLGLAIDTTFDDTSVAVLRGRREVLANITLSQYADHAQEDDQ